jgi:transcriptional regulator with XRE-family HTH domain
MSQLFADALRQLREERGLSRSRLSRLTVRPGSEGVGEKTIQALESVPGRVPQAEIVEALAAALEVAPEVFYEYPIALARRDPEQARALLAGASAPDAPAVVRPIADARGLDRGRAPRPAGSDRSRGARGA